MKGWLSDVAVIIMGQSPDGSSCSTNRSGMPLLNGPTEFGVYSPTPVQWTNVTKRCALAGDLLLCIRGSTTGRMNWADQSYVIGRGLAAIRHKEGVCFQPWLRAVIEYKLSELLVAANGSTFPNLTKELLFTLKVPHHSLAEQKEIAAILGALDDKIENNRKTAATLEEMARALYRSWFVDFDPVHARAAGRAPAHMDAATAALFPDRFGADGLPEEWREGTLQELIYFNPKEKIKRGEMLPYYDMKALPTKGMLPKRPIYKKFTSGTKFRKLDTLLARITPCLENGKTTLVNDTLEEDIAWGSTEFIVMRPREKVPPMLPYCIARNDIFREQAIQTMVGSSGRQRANPYALSEISTVIPTREALLAFEGYTNDFMEEICNVGQQSQTLTTLRDTLLPRLMSGELRVGKAKEMVEEAL